MPPSQRPQRSVEGQTDSRGRAQEGGHQLSFPAMSCGRARINQAQALFDLVWNAQVTPALGTAVARLEARRVQRLGRHRDMGIASCCFTAFVLDRRRVRAR